MNLLIMNKIFYLKLFILTFLTLINCDINTEDNENDGIDSEEQLVNLKQDFERLTEEFLESLKIAHRLVETEDEVTGDAVVRSKRSAQLFERTGDSFFDKGVYRLLGMVPLLPTCYQPIDFTTTTFNGLTYGICVSHPERGIPAKVFVGPITRKGWEQNRISWTVKDPKNVVSFVDEDKDTKERNLYVMIADSASRDGTDVVVINKHNERITKEQHTVNSRYPTAIAVWKSKTDNSYHLAIANSYGTERTQTYKSETFTYNWMQTYFDRYSEMTTYYVKDICAFNIHSNEFIAIANFKAGPNVLRVDSEVFKLDIDRKKWRSFQRIRTFGAVDWEFFTFGSHRHEEYFLAVANNFDIINGRTVYEVNSVIYKFSHNKFVPFQCLPTVGATQIKTFRGHNGEFVLAVANMYQAVHLYQYNGWHFVETSVQYTSGVMSPGVVSLHFAYLPHERSGVLVVSNRHHPYGHLFRMEFVHENPLGEWHNRSLEWCQTTERDVNRFGAHSLSTLFRDVFYVDQKQPIVINDDLVLDELTADSLTAPVVVDDSNGEQMSHKLIDELIELDQEINAAEAKLGQIIDLLSNAMYTNEHQVVTASHDFKSVDFECKPEFDCYFGQINTKVLNKDNINGLAADIVPLNMDQNIDHSMRFQNLRVDKNIILNGVINGINTSHIVTRHGSHDIIAEKTFANEVMVNEVVVSHLINGMAINPSTVLLTNTDQVINNSIKFNDNILLSNIQVNGPINGMNIDEFFSDVITKDRDHIIRGEKHFNVLEMNDLFMSSGATIDGIDIMRLWNDVLWTYGNQEVVAPINFTDIAVEGDLFVDGLINGIRIPNDIILTNESAIILANKKFLRPIILDRMEILDSINGIGLVNRKAGELDLMLKSKAQTVSGKKVFNQIHLGGHSLVRGTVDGVKLSALKRTLLVRNTTQHFDELEIRGNAFFDGGLTVKTTINGFKLEDLYNNTIKLNDRQIPAFPHFYMNRANIRSMDCHSINGLNIGIDLMTKNTRQQISGRKTFMGGIKLDNDLIVRYINGIDMYFINDTLLYDYEQTITGEKTFVNDLWVKDLKVNSINNITINDIVLRNRDQVITAPKVFEDVKIFSDLNVNSFESNVINGVLMKELYENSLQYERPQIVTGRLNVNSILIPKGANLKTRSVNGVNFKHLMSDAVLVDTPQTITGDKTFMAHIGIDRINFTHSFDNVTDDDLKRNWLLQDVSQTINADIVFDHNLRVNDNIFMKIPVINNINLNDLNNNTVKVDEPTLIKGKTHILGPVVSSGHIRLLGRFQGIDLDKEAVTLNADNRFFGRIHLANGFEVDEHLFVNGTVDGVRVEELCRHSVRKNQNQVITGPTRVTGNVLIKGPLTVNIGLNGVNIVGFNRSVVKVDEPSVIKDIMRFRQLVIDGPIRAEKSIAGFSVGNLFDNYMSLSRDQIIKSKIVFRNDLNLNKNLNIKGNVFTQNASINGVNLHRLDSTVLKTFGNQLITGEFTFEDNVYFRKDLNIVNRRINDLDLVKDLMTKRRNNVVFGPKIFIEDIVVKNNLSIKDQKTIGGIDISEMAKFSVKTTDGKHRIIGEKHFNSIEVDHLEVGSINGIEMSGRDLLLTFGDQRINGVKVINRPLKVNSNINSNSVNNINIRKLSSNLVLKGYNNSISSPKTFNRPLHVHNVRAFGRVDSVDLNELNYFIGLPINLLDLRIQLGIEDKKIASLERALEHQSVELAYYELIRAIRSGPALLSYYNPSTRSQHLFISGQHLSNGCQEIEIYFDSYNGLKLLEKLYAIEANLMISFTSNGHNFVVISNSQKAINSDECLKMNVWPQMKHFGSGPAMSQVFRFDRQHNKYKLIAVIHSSSVTDLKTVEDQHNNPCILLAIPAEIGDLGHSIVVCMNPNANFYFKEEIPFTGKDQFSIMRSTSFNQTIMASINSWQSANWMSDITISYWSPQLAHFDHHIQSIAFLNPLTIHWVECHIQSSVFLFASEKKTSLTHKPMVRIFRYNHKQRIPLIEVQQIKGLEVIQMDSIYLDDKQVLVLMLSNNKLDLYRLKGSSGFVRVDRIDVQNAQNFIVSNDYDINGRIDGHLLSISYKECYLKNKNICKEETHVLRSKFYGK